MSNNEIKFQLIETGWFDIYCKYRRCQYLSQCNIEEFNKLRDEDKIYLSADFSSFTYQQMHCLEQLFESKRKKVQRLRKKIKDMLRFDCVFLTLTFSDAFLQSTSAQTRRTYVARFLKSQDGIIRYVANIDFGQNDLYTKREHYHALVQSSCVDLSLWNCGIINAERVFIRNSSALSKYIGKFTSHAYKIGASSTRVITSRNFWNDSIAYDRVAKGLFQLSI